MAINLHTVLLLLAVICAFLAAAGVPSARVNLLALAVFFYLLDRLLAHP